MMQTRRPRTTEPITADVPTITALADVHRRLSSIHYTLAAGSGDTVPRALEKLNTLLREIDDALTVAESKP